MQRYHLNVHQRRRRMHLLEKESAFHWERRGGGEEDRLRRIEVAYCGWQGRYAGRGELDSTVKRHHCEAPKRVTLNGLCLFAAALITPLIVRWAPCGDSRDSILCMHSQRQPRNEPVSWHV